MRLSIIVLFICSFYFTNAQKFKLFVGTYTGSGSKGIYVYNFDASTGKAVWVSNTDSLDNPSYLSLSHNGKYLYAVNETHGDTPGHVSAFNFNNKTGKLKFINTQLSGGDDPCYISVSGDDKWAAIANYSSGSAAVFPLNDDGSLKPYAELMTDTGTSINTQRQERAHVHSAVFSPSYDYLFTPDLGTDKVMIYHFDKSKAEPLELSNPSYISFVPGSGPRHFTFHPDKKHVYIIQELSGTVSAYQYKNGNFKFLQKIITHPKGYSGAIGSADIHLSPDGKFLYASNRADENNITIFSVNAITGMLKLKAYQPVLGTTPRNFNIDPTGKYLLVANQNSDDIIIFKRDVNTGLLRFTGTKIKIPKPVCLQFLKQP